MSGQWQWMKDSGALRKIADMLYGPDQSRPRPHREISIERADNPPLTPEDEDEDDDDDE